MTKKTLRVSAIQFESINRDVEANIKRASTYIQQAADKKAELVLLPEFSTTGYELNERLWDFAEPKVGATTRWLEEEAKKHRIWIGASYLEAEGDNFYNTFVLMNPAGNEVGRVWKETAGSVETYLFKGRKSDHIIETDIGRIGVIVCYDGIMSAPVRTLAEGQYRDTQLINTRNTER
jgi:N-carbamoylputrescine amidase